MNATPSLEHTLAAIAAVDLSWMARAESRQLQLTKPPGSLGRLEEIANRCAAIQATLSPSVEKPVILVFAGDHGVCEEGVNPYPQSVTRQMVANFAAGGAAINALARVARANLWVVDVGVIGPHIPGQIVLTDRIAEGTDNFCRGP